MKISSSCLKYLFAGLAASTLMSCAHSNGNHQHRQRGNHPHRHWPNRQNDTQPKQQKPKRGNQFNDVDRNHDGRLSYDEFLKTKMGNTVRFPRKYFRDIDIGKNGYIGPKEYNAELRRRNF